MQLEVVDVGEKTFDATRTANLYLWLVYIVSYPGL
jgi:hypothetical protein